MKFIFTKKTSRLKKKLLLYFILVAVVSISVSAEIILEMSSSIFQDNIKNNFYQQIEKRISAREISYIKKNINHDAVFKPIFKLRNRMILLLIVVSISIIGAFFLFTKDIVTPMDGMVESTKKIAGGDLTVTVPVMSEDEIGQVAGLINDMNINLQDMIMQIRQEIKRHIEQTIKASFKLSEIIDGNLSKKVIKDKGLCLSDYNKILKISKEVVDILENMSDEMYALQKFVMMYKTYGTHTEISQDEIDEASDNYASGIITETEE